MVLSKEKEFYTQNKSGTTEELTNYFNNNFKFRFGNTNSNNSFEFNLSDKKNKVEPISMENLSYFNYSSLSSSNNNNMND